MFARTRRLLSIATVLLLPVSAALAQDGVNAVKTPGAGQLTMCRSWLLFSSCRDYYNVALPDRIALGDRLPLNFGSNPKDYEFPVERIIRAGGSCTLFDEPAGAAGDGNRIEIASCGDAAGSH
jgi:hypothetical protein